MSEKKPRRQQLQGELFEREERTAQQSPEMWCSDCEGYFPFGTVHDCPYALDEFDDDWLISSLYTTTKS